MTPTQAFGLVVRSSGLFLVIASIWMLMLNKLMQGAVPPGLFYGMLVSLLIGFVLIRWPQWLVAFAFAGSRQEG